MLQMKGAIESGMNYLKIILNKLRVEKFEIESVEKNFNNDR